MRDTGRRAAAAARCGHHRLSGVRDVGLVVGAASYRLSRRQIQLDGTRRPEWTYSVTVRRFDPEADKETTKQLEWTTEVLDAREANGVTAYRVKGWPTDLEEFEQAPVATEKTILRSGNHFLFGASPEPILDNAQGWFTWPVIDGQKICPSAEMVYCWQVTAVENGYALKFYTGPDESTFELEPGTGVSRFHYSHHGTTNEVDAKLVTFTKGKS